MSDIFDPSKPQPMYAGPGYRYRWSDESGTWEDLANKPRVQPMGWQPIDSAPKDGTWITLIGGNPGNYWDGDEDPPMVVAQWDGYDWAFGCYDSGVYGAYENPTHWMPLPTPPQSPLANIA